MATKVIVQLPSNRNYAVRIGSGIIAQLGQNVREIERTHRQRHHRSTWAERAGNRAPVLGARRACRN